MEQAKAEPKSGNSSFLMQNEEPELELKDLTTKTNVPKLIKIKSSKIDPSSVKEVFKQWQKNPQLNILNGGNTFNISHNKNFKMQYERLNDQHISREVYS